MNDFIFELIFIFELSKKTKKNQIQFIIYKTKKYTFAPLKLNQ